MVVFLNFLKRVNILTIVDQATQLVPLPHSKRQEHFRYEKAVEFITLTYNGTKDKTTLLSFTFQCVCDIAYNNCKRISDSVIVIKVC